MKAKLSMGVDRLPFTDGVPLERRGRLMACICVTLVGGNAYDVTLLANERDEFEPDHLAAMFRRMVLMTAPPGEPRPLPPGIYELRPESFKRVG